MRFTCTMRSGSGRSVLHHHFTRLEASACDHVIHHTGFFLQKEYSAVLAFVGEARLGLHRSCCGYFARARTGTEPAGTCWRSAWHVSTIAKHAMKAFPFQNTKDFVAFGSVTVTLWVMGIERKRYSSLATSFEQFFSEPQSANASSLHMPPKATFYQESATNLECHTQEQCTWSHTRHSQWSVSNIKNDAHNSLNTTKQPKAKHEQVARNTS